MKRTRLITLLTLATIASVSAHLLKDSVPAPVAGNIIPLKPELARKENSTARREWMKMRLRDPKTGTVPAGIRTRELEFAAKIPAADNYGDLFSKPGSGAGLQGMKWSSRGPYNIGGRTRALAVDADDPNILLAGGVSGGMWRSSDGGANWSRTTGLEELPSVTCVTQDLRPGKRNVWYYGTGEGIGNSVDFEYYGYGLYKSVDGGRSWNVLPSTSSGAVSSFDDVFDVVWNVAVDPSNLDQDELYVAGAGVIARSTDGGTTWTNVLGADEDMWYYTDVAVTVEGVVYAAIGGFSFEEGPVGVFRSTNGVDWTRIGPQPELPSFGRICLAPAPSNPNVVWIVAETPGEGKSGNIWGGEGHSLWRYTYKSGDGSGSGGEWMNRSSSLPDPEGEYGGFRSQGSYDMVVKVKPDDENVVFIGGTNLYRSTNGFANKTQTTWIGGYKRNAILFDYDYLNHHPDQHAIAFAPNNPRIMYTGNDGGVQRTDDNLAQTVAWTPLNNGYITSQFYAIAIDHGTPGDNTIIGGLQDNGTWRTASLGERDPWVNMAGADGGHCAIADGRTSYYGSTQFGVTYRGVLDSSGALTFYTRVDPRDADGASMFINPFALDPNDSKVMYYAGGSYLWRNRDLTEIPLSLEPAEANWTRMNQTYVDGEFLSSVSVSRANPANRVYFGTSSGGVYRVDDANSANATMTKVSSSLFPQMGWVNCIAVHPNDANTALAVFSNYNVMSLFITTDGGTTWEAIAGNLEEHPDGTGAGPSCRWAEIVPRPEGTIYLVGTSTGLYSTTALSGETTVWTREGGTTIGSAIIDMIKVRHSDGLIVVATHGNGVYSAYAQSAGVEDKENASAAGLRLEQNVPNPAKEVTSIRFHLPAGRIMSELVRLAVYDVRGAEVATLLNRPLRPGEHTVRFDPRAVPGGGLPAGAYHYRLTAGGASVTRTMIVAP